MVLPEYDEEKFMKEKEELHSKLIYEQKRYDEIMEKLEKSEQA